MTIKAVNQVSSYNLTVYLAEKFSMLKIYTVMILITSSQA